MQGLQSQTCDISFSVHSAGSFSKEEEEEEEVWLLDTKALWQETLESATRLAAQDQRFRAALKKHPKVQRWLADYRDGALGKQHVKELAPMVALLTQ